jgi:rubrerythrin
VRDIERLEKRGGDNLPTEEDSLVTQYIQSIVDTKVFPPVSEVPKIAASTSGVVEAVNFGVKAEKRAIEFYSKAGAEAGADEAVEAFARLLEEEKHHLALLTELRSKYTSEPLAEA